MGYDPEYFLCHKDGGLDESLLCVVCQSVYDTPMVLDPCGHSFCRECVASLLDSGHEHCPICRTPMIEGAGVGVPPNRALKELISNLKVRCMNDRIDKETGENSTIQQEQQQHTCSWTGKLSDFRDHAEKHCPLRTVSCPVPGCNFEGPHCSLAQHNADNVALHTELLVASKLERIKEELLQSVGNNSAGNGGSSSGGTDRWDEMQRELKKKDREIQTLKARLLDNWLSDHFFRDWIVAKPHYFRDFCVYRPVKYLTGPISQIIVGIPGPKKTDWEGGLYPLLVTFTPEGYERKEPPKCDFPRDFFHPNVYEGNVHVNTLVEFEGSWDPSIRLPELFFCIQQLLAHPNHRGSLSTSSATGVLYDPMEYRRAIRLQAKKYEHPTDGSNNRGSSDFLERAMVKLHAKIDPEYKKPLQSWENERWENLEEVRWKGMRSFQPRESKFDLDSREDQSFPPRMLPESTTTLTDEENAVDGDVQLIMTTSSDGSEVVTTNSNGSEVAVGRDDGDNEIATSENIGRLPSSRGQIPLIPGRLRNDDGDPCECSCCVIGEGQTTRPFLDRKHRMRFIFGEGG